MAEQRNYRAELEKQIGFLERSCVMFDAGYKDEAIRIATVIRTLLHDTGSMTSLTSHLGAKDIQLATTVLERPSFDPHTSWLPPGMGRPKPGTDVFKVALNMGLAKFIHVSGKGTSVEYKACTEPHCLQGSYPLSEWWNQVVYLYGPARMSRKALVLTAANKDGGAHVDSELTKEYETMMRTAESLKYGYGVAGDGELAYVDLRDIHLVYLRQIGFEILSSADLLALR